MRPAVTYNSLTTTTDITTRILEGFDDPSFSQEHWTQLLRSGDTDAVNLTWLCQRLWWDAFGRGKLLLILAEKSGQPIALAPLFAEDGMIFNICPKDSLDFIGNISDSFILDAILETARAQVPDFVGFRFYFIPNTSRTGQRLQESAVRLDLICYDEGDIPSPALDLAGQPELALAATRKKSLLRDEGYLLRDGRFEVLHFQNGPDILPHLDEYFNQHVVRRAATNTSSRFLDSAQRTYYRRLTEEISHTGWLRFTRVNWNGTPIAFHYGFCYRGRYLYSIPSYAIEFSKHSPGMVLLRQVLLAAIAEGAATFDFGIGDEPYKYRFANHVTNLRTWGLYPQSLIKTK